MTTPFNSRLRKWREDGISIVARPELNEAVAMRTDPISAESMKKISSTNYQKDTLYPAVSRAIAEILQDGEVVTPVEVLLRLQRIGRQQYEDWRFGSIAYLERAFLA